MGFYSKYIFPRVMNLAMSTRIIERERRKILGEVKGDILEIGFGSGLNLQFYPDHVRRITVIDPNSGMSKLANRSIRASRIEVESHTLAGENLPMDDDSFDTVVCTWTLCSIVDPAGALAQVRRVLRPGGRLHFVEHGRSDRPGVARWQDRLNPIQKMIGDGCNLNRPIDQMVSASGLNLLSMDRYDLPKTPAILSHTYHGIAEA